MRTLTNLLRDTGHTSNRIWLILTLVGLLVTASSSNVILAPETLELLGAELRLRPWVLYVGGTWLLGGLWMYGFALQLHGRALGCTLLSNYEKLGFQEVKWNATQDDLLSDPSFFNVTLATSRFRHTLVSKITRFIVNLTVLILISLFPLSVQVLATVQLLTSYGFSWWVIITQVAAILISVGYVVTALGRFKDQKKRWPEYLD